TPLNARVVGVLQRPAYKIEKVIFEIPCAIFTGTFDTRPAMTRVGTLTNAYASQEALETLTARLSMSLANRGALRSARYAESENSFTSRTCSLRMLRPSTI